MGDEFEGLAKFGELAIALLKSGLPAEVLHDVIGDSVKAVSPKAVSEADAIFDAVITERFPKSNPPETD